MADEVSSICVELMIVCDIFEGFRGGMSQRGGQDQAAPKLDLLQFRRSLYHVDRLSVLGMPESALALQGLTGEARRSQQPERTGYTSL